jgi:hypothetical protein
VRICAPVHERAAAILDGPLRLAGLRRAGALAGALAADLERDEAERVREREREPERARELERAGARPRLEGLFFRELRRRVWVATRPPGSWEEQL